jgi:CHC2-type zinc finger protein
LGPITFPRPISITMKYIHGDGFRRKIIEAKTSLPLPELLRHLGYADNAQASSCCPFHDDKRPSFSVFRGRSGDWLWKCHAGCGCGDEITFLEHALTLTRGQAIEHYLQLAEVR